MSKSNISKTKPGSLKINAILNGVKQCCAILFPLITFPYISRVLGSDGLGKYSFSNSITGYFVLIASLGVNTYAIREGAKIREDKDRLSYFCNQVFSINVCSAIISFVALVGLVLINKKISVYAPYIFVQSIAIFLNTLGTDWINSIYEDYKYLTIRYIVFQLVAMGMMFLFVKDVNDVIKYCCVYVFASTGGNLLNFLYVRRYVKMRFTFKMELKRHLLPLFILSINSIAISVYVNSDITMLGFCCDDSVVGVYSFTSKIYNILKQLVHATIVVSLPRIAYVIQNKSDQYEKYMNLIFQALTMVLFPIVAGTFFTSRQIIFVTGGGQYIEGATPLRILSIALIFAIYSAIFTNCALIVNRQEKKCLIATSISAFVNIGLNFFILPTVGIIGAACTTVLAEVVNFFIQVRFSKPYYDWRGFDFKNILSCVVGCLGITACCIVAEKSISNVYICLGISIMVSSVVYVLALIIFKNYVFSSLISRIKGKRFKSIT